MLILFSGGLCLALTGCGAPPPVYIPPTIPNLTGNWQIQSTTTTTPVVGVLLIGALKSDGDQITGTFRFSSYAVPATCAIQNEVINFSGSINSDRLLSLNSVPNSPANLKLTLTVPFNLNTTGAGSITVIGTPCPIATAPAVGAMIAAVSGTFAGTLPPSSAATNPTSSSSTTSITLTQAATPDADGQFPLSATLRYTIDSCSASIPLSGTVSGVGIELISESNPPLVSISSTVNLGATQLDGFTLILDSTPCHFTSPPSLSYVGTLTRQ